MSGVNVRTANQPPRLPLIGYDENHDAFANHAFVVARVSFTGNTDADGYITVEHKPIISRRRLLDNDGNLDVARDILAIDGLGVTLYVGTVLAGNGVVRLYTDAELNTPATDEVGCVLTYWYPAPMEGTVNNDGTFKPSFNAELNGSIAEYGWIKGKAQPAPIEDIAIGIEFDTVTKAKTSYVWDSDTSTWEVC